MEDGAEVRMRRRRRGRRSEEVKAEGEDEFLSLLPLLHLLLHLLLLLFPSIFSFS